ncbi:MAG TPA: AAA family ATPase [Pirellulales bacterium]|nr:AAA family ATPase [Pirellulales bacterium]
MNHEPFRSEEAEMPDQMLKRIRIAGWKSIRDATLAPSAVTVLVGANGAGKSNLVSFFRMLNRLIADDLQLHIGRSGGANAVLHFGAKRTPVMETELNFQTPQGENRYEARFAAAAGDSLIFAEERIEFQRAGIQRAPPPHMLGGGHRETALKASADGGNQTAAVIRSLLGRCRVFHFHDTSDASSLRRSCYVNANRHLYPDGGNAAAMLYLYRETRPVIYRRILSTIRQMAPFIDDFVLEPDKLNVNNITLKWKQPGTDYEFGPHQLSDGTLRMIALTTLLLQPEDDLPLLIALDEPELGLHPAAIGVLGSLARKASHHCQIMLATQSTNFIDCFELGDIVIVKNSGGVTSLERPDLESLKEWLEDYSVGELWEKNVIGGGPYE